MGASASYQMDSHELAQFRKLPLTPDHYELPEVPENRVSTNRKWLLVFGIAIFILLPFMIYTLVYSDSRRLTHGTDNCGNICGFNNKAVYGIPCSGADYRERPFALYEDLEFRPDDDFGTFEIEKKQCVSKCPGGKSDDYFCSEISTIQEISTDDTVDLSYGHVKANWWRFIIAIAITLALSVGALLLFRFATAVVVWSILIFSTLIVIAITILCWVGWARSHEEKSRKNLLILAIIFTIVSIGVIALLAFLFKKIKLVILLYKEATKAVFAMPGLILVPVISALVQVIVIILFITTTVFMLTAGVLTEVSDDKYDYEPTPVMVFSMIYNLIITFWVTQFIVGCQYMVVAGSVAKWFFTRNKEHLSSPIMTSAKVAFTYHLGSICLGSFVITLVAVIKAIIQALIKNDKVKVFVQCCMDSIEQFIKFLSKNAYIEVAIHGQAFFRSGRRAARLLLSNAKSLIAVNSIGDFVLGMTQLLLIIITTAASYGVFLVHGVISPLFFFMIVLNIFIVLIAFAVFETTVDTLFICFCEDKILNDGMSKPYFMTRGLMQFVENSKAVYEKK